MLKITVKDFIEEIKAEIVGYEELGEEKALEWESKFLAIINDPKIKKPYIKEIKGVKHYSLKDESELFAIADNYLAAVDAGEEQQYWEGFR